MTTQFDPQLATSPLAYKVNAFVKASATDPPSLILRPAFQRNMIWNDDQRSYLVDTILRGLPVPEVYIQNNTSAGGDDEIIVVDGQQRISACVDFVLDLFVLATDDEIGADWRGRRFSELSDPLKARFRGFVFVARRYLMCPTKFCATSSADSTAPSSRSSRRNCATRPTPVPSSN